jgi:hypothetical protein
VIFLKTTPLCNEVLGVHQNNAQATHRFVAHFSQNEKTEHISFVAISVVETITVQVCIYFKANNVVL